MILWFSGTGNSRAVAMALADALGDSVCRMDLKGCRKLPPPDKGRIIWVMPVHSWGMPKAVAGYIRHIDIKEAEEARHFLVATCGDDAGLMHRLWRKALKHRGWHGSAAHSVEMPNTYVLLPGFDTDSEAIAALKTVQMKERVGRIAHAIRCHSKIDDIVTGRFAWLKTYIIYPLFMRFLSSPKPFKATDDCIECGRCEKICPLGNITMAQGHKPDWHEKCTLCLGCYHVCPRKAVAYGNATEGKGQWQGEIKELV